MHLADATWTDADAVEADLALLPVGSTEQHGPHAPMGTDTLTPDAIAEAGAGAADGWGEFQSGTNLAYDSAAFSENGVVGDRGRGATNWARRRSTRRSRPWSTYWTASRSVT